MFLKMLRK